MAGRHQKLVGSPIPAWKLTKAITGDSTTNYDMHSPPRDGFALGRDGIVYRYHNGLSGHTEGGPAVICPGMPTTNHEVSGVLESALAEFAVRNSL